MKTDVYLLQLREKFKGRKEISKNDLHHFLEKVNPGLKAASHDKKIYEWKKAGLLNEILAGVYQLETLEKKAFVPRLSPTILKMNKIIKKEFPLISYCIWETRWLTNFMHHIAETNLILIEAGEESAEFVFNYFLGKKSDNRPAGRRELFLNPSAKELNEKVWSSRESVVVKNMVSRSPVQKDGQVSVPKLEKILADLFCDPDLFAPFQGTDLDQIFHYANEFYTISWKSALSYASRRGRDEELLVYLRDLKIITKTALAIERQ